MTLFEFRQAVESAVPWWAPFVTAVVLAALFALSFKKGGRW